MKRVGLRLAPGVVAAVPGDDNDAPWDGNINLFRPSGSISPMPCRFAAFCCRSCSIAIECDGKCRVSRDSIIHYWPDTVRSNAAPSARSSSIESSSSLLCSPCTSNFSAESGQCPPLRTPCAGSFPGCAGGFSPARTRCICSLYHTLSGCAGRCV